MELVCAELSPRVRGRIPAKPGFVDHYGQRWAHLANHLLQLPLASGAARREASHFYPRGVGANPELLAEGRFGDKRGVLPALRVGMASAGMGYGLFNFSVGIA